MARFLILGATLMALSITTAAEPWIIAHRGASADAPENTLAAFALAWEQDADGIECDVRLTADGRVVCIHDATTGRTTGGEKGDGLVVADRALEELQAVDVGAWKDARFAGERIPLLSDALATVPNGKRVFVEVKTGPEIVPELMAVLADSGLSGKQLSVISFDVSVIAAVKAWVSEAEGESSWAGLTANWLTNFEPHRFTKLPTQSDDQVMQALRDSGADGLGCKALLGRVNEALVERLRERKLGFHVWTVDDPEVARYFMELGVDSLTTNRPAALRGELGL